ncbi:hypothetical protein, partial [Paenibacillus alkaliterrae]
LQAVKGIAWIDKEPSMLNVMPVLKREDATATILSWIKKYAGQQNAYSEDVILPNVRYVLKEWKKDDAVHAAKQDVPSIILYCPGIQPSEKEELLGKTLTLSKIVLDDAGEYSRKSWAFNIVQVVDGRYQETVNNLTVTRDEITFVLDEQFALQHGITKGYKDLSIYTENQLSLED